MENSGLEVAELTLRQYASLPSSASPTGAPLQSSAVVAELSLLTACSQPSLNNLQVRQRHLRLLIAPHSRRGHSHPCIDNAQDTSIFIVPVTNLVPPSSGPVDTVSILSPAQERQPPVAHLWPGRWPAGLFTEQWRAGRSLRHTVALRHIRGRPSGHLFRPHKRNGSRRRPHCNHLATGQL